MKEIAEKFQKFCVVPVVVLEDTKDVQYRWRRLWLRAAFHVQR